MKRYRSKVKGPLPVALKSGVISVASKGYFNVKEEDYLSPDLLTKVRTGKLVLKEEKVVIESPDEKKEDESAKTSNEPVSDGDKKGNDSLTKSSEVVESKGTDEAILEDGNDSKEKSDSANEDKTGQGSDVKKGKGRRRNKKGITG